MYVCTYVMFGLFVYLSTNFSQGSETLNYRTWHGYSGGEVTGMIVG